MAQMTTTTPGSISLDHLLDEHVRDAEGRDIGQVEDLILDAGSGTIDFAIVKFGGFLGVGGEYHLIPWPMLRVDTEGRTFTMDVGKEQVDRAPSFDRRHIPRTDDREYLDSVYQYWGMDRAQQHERMSQVAYGEQRATIGAQSQQPSATGTYGEQQVMGYEQQPTGYSGQETQGYSDRDVQGSSGQGAQGYSDQGAQGSSGQGAQGYSGQQSFAEQTGVTGGQQWESGGAGESYAGGSGPAQGTGGVGYDRPAPSQDAYQPSQEPQSGGWIGSSGSSYGGAGQSSGSGRTASDVSYGGGQHGPDRRQGGVHSSTWTGSERRAGW